MKIKQHTNEEIAFAEKLANTPVVNLYEKLLKQATRITELEAQLADWKSLSSAITMGQPIWPNNYSQEVAMVAHEIHAREAQLANLDKLKLDIENALKSIGEYEQENTDLKAQLFYVKQAAQQESDLASQALADLKPYQKDAERYKFYRDGCGDSDVGVYRDAHDSHVKKWIFGKSLDEVTDAAMQAKGKE